jgi:phenylpropionate dioxygenase-like ring-hydroxylating dioxygenase large terminal subunit
MTDSVSVHLASQSIELARGLPGSMYVDPDGFERERRLIFARSWIPIARVDQLQQPGDFVTFDLAGEPLVVVCDKDQQINAYPNVCRHRNTTIMEGAGNSAALQCPNHRWTWSLDGRLVAAPDMETAVDFDRSQECLTALRVEVWQGWVLINLDRNAASFAAAVPGLTARCEEYGLADLVTGPVVRYDSKFNWKIQIENFSESYHHRSVHPETLQPAFPGSQSWAEDNGGEPWLWLDHVSVEPSLEPFTANVAFPMLVFSIARGAGVLWFKLQPHSVDRTTLEIVILVPADAPPELGELLAESIREINDEDVSINERTHAGMRSSFAVPGRISHLERGVWQFRQWLINQLDTRLTTPSTEGPPS